MTASTVATDRLREALLGVLSSGSPGVRESLVVEALLQAESREEHRPFGLELLAEHLRRHPADRPTAAPRLEPVASGRSRIDASGVFAPLAFAAAAIDAVELSREAGVGAVTVRSPGPLGRLAPYARAIAERGAVGFVAVTSPPFVAPLGGTAPALGTNPFAAAIPTSDGIVVVDAATSEATKAAWTVARRTGAALPRGSAVDSYGEPTTDPHEAAALTPRGGLIGTLAGILIEIIAGGSTGVLGSSPADRGGLVLALPPDTPGSALAAVGDDLAGRLVEAGGRVPGHLEPLPPRLPRSAALEAILPGDVL